MSMVLGRQQHDVRLQEALEQLKEERVLITGGSGSIGSVLGPLLFEAGLQCLSSDADSVDVTDPQQVKHVASWWRPTLVFHLAADKHAPNGEEDPFTTTFVNTYGTFNVLTAFDNAKVVLTSTCKACAPETAYGASKLIAERMVLNEGGVVARLYNVIDTHGNVFRLWEQLEETQPLPVTSCTRYFISCEEAVGLVLWSALLPSGRYVVDPGQRLPMQLVAQWLYPKRERTLMRPRRGDRLDEPRVAAHERLVSVGGAWPSWIERVESPHDVVEERDSE